MASIVARCRATSRCSRAAGHPAPSPARPRLVSRAAGSGNKDVESMLAEANALLNAVASGAPRAQLPGVQESIDELTELGFVCDESGCVLVLPNQSGSDDEGAQQSFSSYVSGRGWGIGMVEDADDIDYPAVVSGPGWRIPMRASEIADLLSVLQQLRAAVNSLHKQGQWLPAASDRPASRAKWQSKDITMQATWGIADKEPSFSIELTFRTGRRNVTTTWPADIAGQICSTLDGPSAKAGATVRSAAAA